MRALPMSTSSISVRTPSEKHGVGADCPGTLTWTAVNTDIKHNRLSHTSTQVGSYLFVLGGHNGQTYAQDVLLFNLGVSTVLLTTRGCELMRCSHAAMGIQGATRPPTPWKRVPRRLAARCADLHFRGV